MLRRPTSETDPADWVALAAERLHGADVLWANLGLSALGIEALQEAAERYLKGFLIAKGWRLAKTHDLKRLLLEAEAYDQRFARFHGFAEELTEDFFAQHYPGEDLTDVGENYEALRRQAGELVALIRQSLPEYWPKPGDTPSAQPKD
jgi:HEPN domain-containing protein